MIILINCDGDSGMTDLNGIQLEPFMCGEEYAYILKSYNEKELFIEAWYNRMLGLNDNVFNVLTCLFEETTIISDILNDKFESYENGNYSIRLLNENNLCSLRKISLDILNSKGNK